ncbi:MAG: DUF1997 domain-containing protein [Synechococcus sp. ChSW.bin.154]
MPRQDTVMPLAFRASQHLDLPISDESERLRAYLHEHDRVVKALLDSNQLTALAPGRYLYTVTTLQVFQLHVKPVVSLEVDEVSGRLRIRALDADLEGLGLVDDFQLSLEALLEATPRGLQGEATLSVEVSQPPLLRLIPKRVLESTGESILNGILLTIKGRVGRQLVADFQSWARDLDTPPASESALLGGE